MNQKQNLSKWQRVQETLFIYLLKDIPTRLIGGNLRNLLYRYIFAGIGSSSYIEHGVRFFATSCIEIGNAEILCDACIDAREGSNNRIYLKDGVSIQHGAYIRVLYNSVIEIDERALIGRSAYIVGGDIKIGKDCLIAARVGIIAANHNFADPMQKIVDQGVTCKGIVIEDNCWLGYGVIVLDGVTIGKGSVIGAGAVVTKDIPSFSVAVGVPAQVVKSRNSTKLYPSDSNIGDQGGGQYL